MRGLSFRLVCLMCAYTTLTARWFQHSQMKFRFHHLLLVRCDWEIHLHFVVPLWKKSNPKSFFAFFAHPWAYLYCDNLVENSAWNLWKFARKFWNCEAPPFTNFLSTLWTVSSLTTHGLFIANSCSPIFEHSTPLSYSSFTLRLYHKPRS
jgi:hypothetical protein